MHMNAVLHKILNSEFLERAGLPEKGWDRTITVALCGPLGSLARVPPGEPVPLFALVAYTG